MAPTAFKTMESHYPAYSLLCADTVSVYQSKKAQGRAPDTSLEEAKKVVDCLRKTIEKLQESPCDGIRKAYEDCLEQNGLTKCSALKSQLEECAVQIIGKLD